MYQKFWVIVAICFLVTLPNMGQNQLNFPDYGSPIRLEVAKQIVFKAQSEAKKNGWKMVISVVDSGGNLVLLEKMDGAQFASIDISQGKAKCANNFRRSTKTMEETVAAGGIGLRILTLPGVYPLEGGELILIDGKIAGAIGVSGGTSVQDGQVARSGLEILKE
ncbi:heme-binding protein [Leptospira noguchii]|uniref:PF03928 domain protein n=1 Tax=Leptospira noguchii str. 2007001578 TaxID=1049974 RepID=A0ABP2T4F3_9LEPT|nr:heme-binding protein [Leptospira noguchii]EMI68323.1 PF03928 domain protein [Leptospira noguchii str. Bonito]EMM99208.1 PF03928 domain protein [Leptospira noguchii str. 2007001578]UOG37545.1 heme-binding protein [Leptospira noguchii]UOG60254.1 heme-binding protein [Leptospira noguchii]